MKIKGPRKLVKRARFIAKLLGIKDFKLKIKWGKYAYCEQLHSGTFVIQMDEKAPKYSWVEILGHEMVHLKQYLTGRLVDHKKFTKWEGKLHAPQEFMSDAYFLSPWEMEARALEAWIQYKWDER